LLEKKIEGPVDWSFGMSPFLGWNHFSQAIRLGTDTTITKATLKMEVKTHYDVFGSEYGNVCFAFAFNDSPLPGETKLYPDIPGFSWWTGTKKTLTFDVTDKYRALAGETPQILSVGVGSFPPGQYSYIILTAYLDIEYTGTEPTGTGAGGSAEPTGTESLGEMMSFMMNMMMLMMLMSMMVSVMSGITESVSS
jgi:hypothetical protein